MKPAVYMLRNQNPDTPRQRSSHGNPSNEPSGTWRLRGNHSGPSRRRQEEPGPADQACCCRRRTADAARRGGAHGPWCAGLWLCQRRCRRRRCPFGSCPKWQIRLRRSAAGPIRGASRSPPSLRTMIRGQPVVYQSFDSQSYGGTGRFEREPWFSSVLPTWSKPKIVRPMRVFVLLIVALIGATSTAFGQSNDWVVLPVTTGEDPVWVSPTVEMINESLTEQRVSAWPPARAATRFEETGSSPSTKTTETEIEEWVTRAREAIRHVARGDYSRALKELGEAQAVFREVADELNREQRRAQNVLDTCLYMVRALLETGSQSRARSQAQQCVMLVPRGEPNEHMHPPNVVQLYKEARLPDPEQMGSLAVESAPSGCDVRINGVRFGKTPFEMTDLYHGTYLVQVECDPDRRGRVHSVVVGEGKAKTFVDTRFDRTVDTQPVLTLSYQERPDDRILLRDAEEVAKVLPAGAVILTYMIGIDVMELRMVSGAKRGTGLAQITTTAVGPSATDVSRAVKTLIAGECSDFTGPKPSTIDCKTGRVRAQAKTGDRPTSGWPPDRTPRGQFITGVTLASVGTLSLLTGYGLFAGRARTGDNWVQQATNFESDPSLENKTADFQNTWLNMKAGVIASATAGSALLVTSIPLALPYRSKTPWWAWLSGGLGVGAAAASIALGVTAPAGPANSSCNAFQTTGQGAQACVDRGRRIDAAILVGATSAPLLTMPLVYLLRRSDKRVAVELTPTVQASRTGATLGLEGVF